MFPVQVVNLMMFEYSVFMWADILRKIKSFCLHII